MGEVGEKAREDKEARAGVVTARRALYWLMSDEEPMRRAIRLAKRGRGWVEPNPLVGCVLVRDGDVVGEGWHRAFGGPHAEVEAIRSAGERARGATAYVPLEPCAHEGKTPPCTEALREAGVGRVVVGTRDPFHEPGGGLATLREAGVAVTEGVLEERCRDLNRAFLKRTATGLPYVIGKWAMTADGAIATGTGDSRWISGPRSRRLVHRLRARVDAVVVGAETAVADDPELTARGVPLRRVARRVVIDPKGRVTPDSRLLQTVDSAPVTVVVADASEAETGRLERAGAEGVACPADETGAVDLHGALAHLVREHAATHVLVEGGGVTHGRLVDAGLVDELWVFVGPYLLGDPEGRRPVRRGGRPTSISEAAPLRLTGLRRIDRDVLLQYRVGEGSGSWRGAWAPRS